jgi:hypothetical protein
VKISEKESESLFEIFWNNPFKNDKSKSLSERSMQQFWYNKNKFPFEPYYDCQPIGFDTNPKTYQDVLILQERYKKEFLKKSGWITQLNKSMI